MGQAGWTDLRNVSIVSVRILALMLWCGSQITHLDCMSVAYEQLFIAMGGPERCRAA